MSYPPPTFKSTNRITIRFSQLTEITIIEIRFDREKGIDQLLWHQNTRHSAYLVTKRWNDPYYIFLVSRLFYLEKVTVLNFLLSNLLSNHLSRNSPVFSAFSYDSLTVSAKGRSFFSQRRNAFVSLWIFGSFRN